MSDIVLSPQTLAVVVSLVTTMALVISALSGVIAYLYRQHAKMYERLLEQSEARLIDAWRREEEKDIRILTLETSTERLTHLAVDATAGWRNSVTVSREHQQHLPP